ncbi:MAG: hypothetical protein ACE5FU_05485 [Nitrospinota bacterium]
MPAKEVALLKTGALTPVGIGTAQTAASIRAGITRTSETSIYDKQFNPVVMGLLPEDVLPPLNPSLENVALTSRQSRMFRLSAPALQEALKDLPGSEQVPLYLGVPEAFPERANPAHDLFIEHLCTQSEIQLNIADSKLFHNGRAAGLFALKEAIEVLLSGAHKQVVVGGVDTYVDLYLLGTLDMEGRILGPTVMDGFIPGEGAGFILLSGATNNPKSDAFPPLGKLSQVATGFEEGHLYSDKPYKGDGLGSMVVSFFQENPLNKKIKDIYSSMNGENHWAKEWGVAYLRSSKSFYDDYTMHHPAEYYGDPGAASGILMVILATLAVNKSFQPGPTFVTCSSDFGDRAAVAVSSCKGET